MTAGIILMLIGGLLLVTGLALAWIAMGPQAPSERSEGVPRPPRIKNLDPPQNTIE